jgi:hypothetical protein
VNFVGLGRLRRLEEWSIPRELLAIRLALEVEEDAERVELGGTQRHILVVNVRAHKSEE